jgi:RNA polymerase sigma factor (sigma-70 family)
MLSPSPNSAGTTAAGPSEGCEPIETLLLRWQSTGADDHLELLIAIVLPLAERMAATTLQRQGILDPHAVDEAISLLLDHLRRLPGSPDGGQHVAAFAPRRIAGCDCSLVDTGRAYILWLARERAADVGRARRRHARKATVFSQLGDTAASSLRQCIAPSDATGEAIASEADLCTRLRESTHRLPPRERMVIELLLEGKSQIVISHALDICEGTVSRLRTRAIASLRSLMAE